MEAAEVELEHQRQDFALQYVMQPLNNDNDARTGAPRTLHFPRAAYNMAATICRLEDISDMPDPKTNERLHEAKRLLHVALKQ
jgi:hypothetical protein